MRIIVTALSLSLVAFVVGCTAPPAPDAEIDVDCRSQNPGHIYLYDEPVYDEVAAAVLELLDAAGHEEYETTHFAAELEAKLFPWRKTIEARKLDLGAIAYQTSNELVSEQATKGAAGEKLPVHELHWQRVMRTDESLQLELFVEDDEIVKINFRPCVKKVTGGRGYTFVSSFDLLDQRWKKGIWGIEQVRARMELSFYLGPHVRTINKEITIYCDSKIE